MPARAVQLGQTGLCQRAEHGLIRGGVDMVAFLEVAELHAVRGAQTKHKVLVLPLEVGDFLLVPHGGRAVCKGGDVARERKPAPVKKRVGARAETDVFGKIPVFAVVPRAEAGQGKIRNLVVFKAVLTQDAAQGERGVRLRIIVREDGASRPISVMGSSLRP